MKKSKLLVITKIFAIIVICLVSFGGIYVQKLNKMENITKEFKLSKDLSGYREVALDVISDESEENKNVENYEKSKAIIEKRLKTLNVEDYNLSLNKETGKIYLQIPENSNTDLVVSNIAQSAKLEIKDSKDEKVYINNSHIKDINVGSGTTESNQTVVGIMVQLNEEGTAILKDLSENTYKTIEKKSEDETTENAESNESEEEQKQVSLTVSGATVRTKSFDAPVTNGLINDWIVGSPSKDNSVITENITNASLMINILKIGELPIEYNISVNRYVQTDITSQQIKTVIISVTIIVGLLLLYMIIKYKVSGILAAISYIGFIALYLLLLRYTNVVIAVEGIMGIILMVVINYIITMHTLKTLQDDKKNYNKEYINTIIKLIPLFALSIIFCFTKVTVLESIGMAVFWGILLILVYNRITKYIVD